MDNMLGTMNAAYVNNKVNQSTNTLENKLNNSDLSKATDDELMAVCKDFEQYFVEQMMKAMIKMSKVDSTDDDNMYASLFGVTEDSGSYMSTMSSYFGDSMVTQLSKTMTEAQGGNGFGIAKTLYEQMKRNYSVPAAEGAGTSKTEDAV